MSNIDDFDFFDDEEEDVEEIKATRKKRIQNKRRRDRRRDYDEVRLRPLPNRRPRTKIHYDPDFDEDDYEQFM